MAYARTNFPDVFASYQEHTKPVNKSAPPTYEDLVAAEMKKGCNFQTAAQRVAQLHGFRAFDNQTSFAKADVASAALENVADSLHQSDASLSRCEALRAARKARPDL